MGSQAGLALECTETRRESIRKAGRAAKCLLGALGFDFPVCCMPCTGKAGPWPSLKELYYFITVFYYGIIISLSTF